MSISDLSSALNEGVVIFQFIKSDGSIRAARGTTGPDLVPADNRPKGVRTPARQATLRGFIVAKFYDMYPVR